MPVLMPRWEYFTEQHLGNMSRVLQRKRLKAVHHRYGVLSIIKNTVLGKVTAVLREYLWPCLYEQLPNPLEVMVQRDWMIRNLQLVEKALHIQYYEKVLQVLRGTAAMPLRYNIECEHTVEGVNFTWNPYVNYSAGG